MTGHDIIIADAGSTKTTWAFITPDSEEATLVSSPGVNALLTPREEIAEIFRTVAEKYRLTSLAHNGPAEVSIHFYGAGCATPELCAQVASLLEEAFSPVETEVGSDLLGAARSLLGHSSGIACILGTGSNSCLYDGSRISMQIPSLGFILGDEGSGAALGKRLVSDVFKNELPEELVGEFLEETGLSISSALENVYRRPNANRYLASFVPFLSARLWHPRIYSLVLEELTRFIRRNASRYPGSQSLPVAFTGSVAYVFERLLHEAASSQGLKVTKITKSPIQGLVDYHRNQ